MKSCCFGHRLAVPGLLVNKQGNENTPAVAPELLAALRRAAQPFAEQEGVRMGLITGTGAAYGPVLGRTLGADLHILAAAALLHDIGRSEESASRAICHARRGAELARPILQELGYESKATTPSATPSTPTASEVR